MTPDQYMAAARVPHTLKPQEFGLWNIERITAAAVLDHYRQRGLPIEDVGFPDYTLLRHYTEATLHNGGEIVMEDSRRELRKHLPIWMAARGRVLITGLGLGCVVRGLLAKPSVDHITVIEIDQQIIDVIGPEFASDPRVSIYQDDALKWEPGDRRFDFAWHDIWTERNEGLQALHGRLMRKHRDIPLENQGAWNFPRLTHRSIAKIFGKPLLGGPTRRFSCVT